MANDLVPDGKPGWLANANLPQLLLGPAGKAISRLLGALAEIPAAKLDGYVRGIRDNTEARTIVSRKIAEAVGAEASTDKAIINNAMANLVPKAYRETTNKLAVLEKTIEHLNEEPPPSDAPEIDDDWLNVFERHAENASSAKLRDLWRRILAGEIRRPGTFALRTLNFISQLDQRVASIFERTIDAVVQEAFIPIPSNLQGAPLDDLLELQDFGLVIGVGGMLSRGVTLSPSTLWRYDHERGLAIYGTDGAKINISCVNLTRAGQEVYRLLRPPFNIERAKEATELIDNGNVTEIKLVRYTTEGDHFRIWPIQTLWEKQTPSAS